MSMLYDEHGTPVVVQLDLRNKMLRKFYEKMMEDFEDTLNVIQALEDDDDERIPWNVVKAGLEAQWNKELAEWNTRLSQALLHGNN